MSECFVKFQSPVSKGTINYLVVEYLKYILYYRGQFPLPLDQLKQTIHSLDSSVKIDNHEIYSDYTPSHALQKTSKLRERTRQNFLDSIRKFDEFFNQLQFILQNEEVLELVMNLGPNMMNPKELHRITLPQTCTDFQSVNDPKALQRYRLEFFKTVMHSSILQDGNLENPIPISILLRLKSGVTLKEYMEQKRFYSPPTKCRQVLLRFDDSFHCDEVLHQLERFKDITISPSNARNSDLWVKLKSELKGFKDFLETQPSLSNNKIY